jgi:hypothetical protein
MSCRPIAQLEVRPMKWALRDFLMAFVLLALLLMIGFLFLDSSNISFD